MESRLRAVFLADEAPDLIREYPKAKPSGSPLAVVHHVVVDVSALEAYVPVGDGVTLPARFSVAVVSKSRDAERPDLAHIVSFAVVDGAVRVARVEVVPDGDREVLGVDLDRLKLDNIRDFAVRRIASEPGTIQARTDPGAVGARLERASRSDRGDLERVAALYAEFVDAQPVKQIALIMNRSEAWASEKVKRAREAGLITVAARRGRPRKDGVS